MNRSALLCIGLIATPAQALRLDPPKCTDVPGCVVLAEKTPAKFSPFLHEEFEKLPGAVLIEGLQYTHPREAVNKLVREQLFEALGKSDGHTPASARTLLELAQAADDPRTRLGWIDLLSSDQAGRAVLVTFIDGEAKGERRLEAMIAYVENAGQPTPSEMASAIQRGTYEFDAPPVVRPEIIPIVTRYVDELWSTYLQVRKQDANPQRNALRYLISRRPEFVDRFAALVRAEVETGTLPMRDELETLTGLAIKNRQIAREMLGWTNTPNQDLRRLIVHCFEGLLYYKPFKQEDTPLVRKMLLTSLKDQADSKRSTFLYHLVSFLDGMSADEALEVAQAVEAVTKDGDEYRNRILIRVAEVRPEYREPYLRELTTASIEDLEGFVNAFQNSAPWMREFAASWITSQTPETLRDEIVQERFLVLARLLENWGGQSLPKTRRAHVEAGIYRCYGGPVLAYRAAVQEREDLAALGQPLPAKTPEEQVPEAGRPGHHEMNKVPAAPPMTPQEATVRWQQFVVARESVLRKVAKAGKKSGAR